MEKVEILILTARIGSGHLAVAKAIKQHLLMENSQLNIKIIDLYAYLYPKNYEALYSSYEWMIRHMPQIYNIRYRLREKKGVKPSKKHLNRFCELIKEHNPGMVISTYPVSTALMAKYKKVHNSKIPLVTCITDVVSHNEWLNKECDRYFVPDESVKEAMVNKGFSSHSIDVVGIVLKPLYYENCNYEEIRASLGLSKEQKVILMMGGIMGLLPRQKAFYRWMDQRIGVQTIVLTGRNKRLYNKLLKMDFKQVKVEEFSEYVYQYMQIAEFIIGKSGGITLYECIASSLPMVVYRPFLGQELRNCKFIEKNGLGFKVHSIKELKTAVMDMLASSSEKDGMKRNLNKLRTRLDRKLLVNEIMNVYKKHKVS